MKIGINLLPFREKMGGVGQYAKSILDEISRMDRQNEYILYLTSNATKHFNYKNKNFKKVVCSFNSNNIFGRIYWEQLRFTKILKNDNIDLLFSPSVVIPFSFRGRSISTIHDIAFVRLKKKYPFLRRKYISLVTKSALKTSTQILTVSNFSKDEIINHYNIDPSKITVAKNGVTKKFLDKPDKDILINIKKKYVLPDKYILYVGAIEPGKNLDQLIKAFELFEKKDNENVHLVLTGGLGWQRDYVSGIVSNKNVLKKIVTLPYIPDKDLPVIYHLSDTIAYISLYEGFGLPVLEALACGKTVVTSKAEAIQEFAKDAVISVNENSVEEITDGLIKSFSNNPEIVNKQKIGIKIAQKHNWGVTAQIIMNEFNRIGERYGL